MIRSMASDDGKPTATVLRIKVRHPDVDSFVDRFASQVTRSGVFIPTRTPKPVGTEVRFEIRTADDRPVLVGQGKVRLVRPHDPQHPRVVAGMAVELQRVGKDSREVLLRMLEVRKRRGLVDGPGGMPLPGEPEHDDKDDVTVARPPRPRAPTVVPDDAADAVPLAPPAPPPPTAPLLAPLAPRPRPSLDVSALAAPPPPDDELEAWPEASRPLDEVLARARALLADSGEIDRELEALAQPTAPLDRAAAAAAVAAALGRAPRAPSPAAPPLRAAPALPPPIAGPVDDATGDATFDAPTAVAPLPPAVPPPPAPPVESPAAPPTEDPALARAAAEAAAQAAEDAARARAARAQRERAKREANDRALRERNERIQRELAARARARPPAADPLADLDLDGPADAGDREVTRKVPLPPARRAAVRVPEPPPRDARAREPAATRETTRRVDAATLAAEALGAADLRSSLAAGATAADLEFLERLSLESSAPPPRTAATVRRIPPRTSPPPPAPAAPAAPPAAPGPANDDDDDLDISIEFDD